MRELADDAEGAVLAADVHHAAAVRIERRVGERDDEGPVGAHQLGHGSVRAHDHGHDVEVVDLAVGLFDVVGRDVNQLAEGVAQAGVGDEGVELAERLHRVAHGTLVVLHLGDVRGDADHAVAVLLAAVVEPFLNHVDDGDTRALLDVAVDDAASDPGSTTGDDGDLIFKSVPRSLRYCYWWPRAPPLPRR